MRNLTESYRNILNFILVILLYFGNPTDIFSKQNFKRAKENYESTIGNMFSFISNLHIEANVLKNDPMLVFQNALNEPCSPKHSFREDKKKLHIT